MIPLQQTLRIKKIIIRSSSDTYMNNYNNFKSSIPYFMIRYVNEGFKFLCPLNKVHCNYLDCKTQDAVVIITLNSYISVETIINSCIDCCIKILVFISG